MYLRVSYGASIAWLSSSILILKSFETPINNGLPMTDSQISWITSLLGLGGLFGTVISGTFADIFGRKKILCLSLLQTVSFFFRINGVFHSIMFRIRYSNIGDSYKPNL